MKNLLTILFFAFFSLCASLSQAQGVPQGINYQAIARDNAGAPIANQTIAVKIDIQDTSNSTLYYSETFLPVVTNSYGLFTLVIGHGTPTTSSFIALDWSKAMSAAISIDPTGAGNYIYAGTAAFNSVPYALYAATAGTAANGISQQVAFNVAVPFAYQNIGTSSAPSMIATYSNATLDNTSSVNLGTGTFTAPSAGLYTFTASVAFNPQPGVGSVSSITVGIVPNNTYATNSVTCIGNIGTFQNCTVSDVILQLAQGATVQVLVNNISNNIASDGTRISGGYFTGHKLY